MTKRSFTLLGVLFLTLTACAGSGETATTAPTGPAVYVRNLVYEPAGITVEVDQSLTWVWDDDGTAHDVVGDGFRSELQTTGTFVHTFDAAGVYSYVCSIHPTMIGTVTVEAGG
ncbi:MAG: copper-binding protein [Acidimicrobiia bacterium]